MKCTRCNCEKESKSFHIATRRKDGTPIYRKYCNECYKLVKDKRNLKLKEEFVAYKKGLNCTSCKMSFSEKPWLCDFHHTDGDTKEKDIATMRLSRPSWKTLKKEIDKCIPLCANCHRDIHHGI